MTEGDTSQTTPTTGIPESRLLEIEGMSYNPFSWIDSVTQGVDDIPARMNAIEQQLAALTGASADEASAILEDRDSIFPLLWEGSWSTGTITVPGISKMVAVFLVLGNGQGFLVPAASIVASEFDTYVDNKADALLGHFRIRFDRTDDTLTAVDIAYYISGSRYQHSVTRIYGLA